MWYPENKQELERVLSQYLKQEIKLKEKPKTITGLIVPHAGYEFSGAIAGKAFSLFQDQKRNKAVIIGPSHYTYLTGTVTSDKQEWQTPLGKIKLFNTDFPKTNIDQEHSITNQIPFLQKINPDIQILPLMMGQITNEQAKQIAEKISKINALYIFSTDLSHFLPYDQALKKDRQTIQAITSLNSKKLTENSACGIFPLLILIELCKIKNLKPHLIEYKNSGDVIGDKSGVVGYSSFWF